jgi:hypothetical protein
VPFSFFEGTWVGTWDGAIDSGPATITIDAAGDAWGTMHSDGANVDGDVTGAIENTGAVSLTVTFPGEPPVNGTGTLVLVNAGTRLQGVVDFAGDQVTFVLDGP